MDTSIALKAAKKYHDAFAQQLGRFQTPISEPLSVDVSEVVFLATNLIFATELYLKIGIRLQRSQPPKTHHLSELFDMLLEENKARIEEAYEHRMRDYRKTSLATSHDLFLALRPEDPPATEEDYMARTTVAKILAETGTSYTTWRYLFAELSDSEPRLLLTFHHTGLHFICQTMEALLSNVAGSKKGPLV